MTMGRNIRSLAWHTTLEIKYMYLHTSFSLAEEMQTVVLP
jgi:hypothetical protein